MSERFSSIYDLIIARKWWDAETERFPFHAITTKSRRVHPQSMTEACGPNFVYRTTGLRDGNRIWGFKTAVDRKYFMNKVCDVEIENQAYVL